jgi:hypothetical protein
MKCLSLLQPFAALIVSGSKQYETRSWRTDYRGTLAIHASRRFPETARQLCLDEPYRYLLQQAGYRHSSDLPRGVLLGTVELLDCVPAEEVYPCLSEDEICLGNFSLGRWAWKLANPLPLAMPVPWCGRLGLFDVPSWRSHEESA